MELDQLATTLTSLGCPADKSREMAGALDKRAHQLAEKTGRNYEEALVHLLALMREGMSSNPPSPSLPPHGNDAP